MADPIVIKLEVDNTELVSTVDLLDKLGLVDKQTAESFRKATGDYAARQKAVAELNTTTKQTTENAKATTKGVEDLSKATTNLSNSIANGALDEFSKDLQLGIQDALNEAGVTVEEFAANLERAFGEQKGIVINTDLAGKSLRELQELAVELADRLGDLSPETEEFIQTAVRLNDVKTKIKELTESVNEYRESIEKRTEIFINADKATASMEEIGAAVSILRKDIETLNPASQQFADSSVKLKAYEDRIQSIQLKVKSLQTDLKKQTEIFIKADSAEASLNDLKAAIDLAQERLNGLSPNTDEFVTASKQLDDYKNKLQAVNDKVDSYSKKNTEATGATKTLKGQLREMKEELSRLEQAGQEGSAEFEQLAIKAAKLEDQIGDTNARIRALASDNFVFEGITSGINGLVGAFAAAEGASALFGNENKELQETLVKLNAAIALSNGLAQVKATLEKQSAAVQLVSLGQQKLIIVQTYLENAAKSQNVIVSNAAAVAQRILNAVQAASPAGLLVLTIGALAAAYAFLSSNTEDAAEKQIKLNNAQKAEFENLKTLNELANKPIQDRIDALDKEIKLAKARGDSADSILRKEIELEQQKSRLANVSIGNLEVQKNRLKDLEAQYESATNTLKELKVKVSFAPDDEDLQKQLEAQQGVVDNLKAILDEGVKLNKDAAAARTEIELKNVELDKQRQADLLSNQKAAIDARVLLAKVGSDARLKAEIEAVEKEKQIRLEGESSPDKRTLIEAESLKKINELRSQYIIREINAQKALNEAKLVAVQKNSEEELALRIRNIELVASAELNKTDITEAEKKAIRLRRDNEIIALRTEAQQQQFDRELNFDKQSIALRLAVEREGSREQLRLKLEAIENQADADKLAAQNSITDKLQLAERILEIDSKTAKDKLDLTNQVYAAEIDRATTAAKRIVELENIKLKAKLSDPDLNVIEKLNIQKQINDNELLMIQSSLSALENKHTKGLISEEEYQNSLFELTRDRLLNEIEEEGRAAEEIRVIRQLTFDFIQQTAQQVSDFIFTLNQNENNAIVNDQLQGLNKRKEAELANKKLTEDEKKKINDRYAKEEAKIKNDAAKKQRDADLIQASVNGALGLTKSLVELGPPVPPNIKGILGFASVLLTTGLQIADISARPLPKYFKGTEFLKRGIYPIGRDTIPVMAHEGERITPADVNKDYFPALNVIQRRQISPDIANDLLTSYAKMKTNYNFDYEIGDDVLREVRVNNNYYIDENKIGEVVSREMRKVLEEQGYHNEKLVRGISKSLVQSNTLKENSYRR